MSKLNHPIFDLLRADAHISVNKALRWALGNDEATIYSELLSRNAYFSDRDKLDPDGFFFNTIEDLYAGTHIADKAQRSAITNLKNLGLIDVKVQGIPAMRFFKIIDCPTILSDLLQKGKMLALNARNATKMHSITKRSELVLPLGKGNKKKNKAEHFTGVPDKPLEQENNVGGGGGSLPRDDLRMWAASGPKKRSFNG
uniref:Uncharacterized protein n=1 Tax=viral metagenome TaxID=1070528 RepID=A0A6H2A2C3_9ZZZZ